MRTMLAGSHGCDYFLAIKTLPNDVSRLNDLLKNISGPKIFEIFFKNIKVCRFFVHRPENLIN